MVQCIVLLDLFHSLTVLVFIVTRGDNVFNLLARREVAPRAKHSTKKLWIGSSEGCVYSFDPLLEAGRDARRGLISW